MPQTNKPSAGISESIIPLTSGATDNPAAPQTPAPDPTKKVTSTNEDDLFPLLSKSPGFKQAMMKADASGQTDEATTLPPAMTMMRNLRIMEGSELYRGATPRNKVLMQEAFYKKYVMPAQKAAQYKGSFAEWVKDRGTHWQYQVNPASQDKPLGGLIPGGMTKKSSAESEKRSAETGTIIASGMGRRALEIAKTLDDARRTAIFHFKNISKELSFGHAMLDASIAPHMGPIIMDPHYQAVRKDGTTQEIRQLLKDDDYYALNGYQQTTANKILRGTGKIVGDIPLFFATDGIAAIPADSFKGIETAEQARKVLSMPAIQNIGMRAIGNSAQGYIIGTLEGDKNPAKTAAWFGAGSMATGISAHVAMRGLISPSARYLSSIFGWGGGKLTGELANQAEAAIISKAPQATVSPASIALAGSPKQKISASVISALNNLTNGEFAKAPAAAKRVALAKLAATSPEFAQQIAYLDKTIIGTEAAQNLVAQRDAVPEFNAVMTKLEQASKEPTHISIANAAHDNSEAQLMRRSSDKWVQEMFKDPAIRESIQKDISKYTGPERRTALGPGAAYAKSLEFGENLTAHVDNRLEEIGLGKKVLQFETRADKLLFYLNVAQAELMQNGPSPGRDKEFQLLLSKLSEEFPGERGSLANLIKMSDKIWGDMEQATSAGIFKEGETFRYWRQHSRPGESPFAHEVELLQQAQKAEDTRVTELKMEMAGKTPEEIKPQEAKPPQTDDEKLKAAFAKSGDKGTGTVDTQILRTVTDKLFPGRQYAKLTPDEQSEVNQIAGAISKGMKKGNK